MEGANAVFMRWICMLLMCGVAAQDVRTATTTSTGESVKLVEVGVGESAILPCYQRATGSFLLEWERRDLPDSIFILLTPKVNAPHIDARYAGRLDVAEDGVSLQIGAIKVEDAGYYQCTVQPLTNWDRSSNFTWISLVIRAPPVFLSTSPYRRVSGVGSRVTFFCVTNMPSSTTITWLKDKQPITLENRFELTSDSLIISHLVVRDGGIYTCQAENTLGTSEYTMLLILEGAPYIIDPPQNITVREDMPATFKCGWDASPDNVTVHWYYDSEPVQSLAKFGLYADILLEGSLYIGDTDKAFSGWYTCSPSNGIGTPPTARAFLSVQYLATPLPMPSEVVGALGYPITLDCRADSNPAISSTIWRKDSTILYPSADERLKLSKSGSLTIDNVQNSDEGFYSCQPYNSLGSAGESGSTYLLVRDAPIFTSRPKAYYQRMPGEEVSIPCTASGSPPPTVTWQKVGGSLPSSRVVTQDDVLKIVQLRKEDHGMYECIISNVVTTLVTSTQLIIEQTSPHAPYNVSVVMTSRSAFISWQPAYDGGLAQSYTVWFRTYNVQDSQWTTLPLLPEDVTSATLYNLRPNTQYEFSVISSNVLGKSMFSEVVIASTKDPDYLIVPTDTSGRTLVPIWSVLSPSPPRTVFINSTPSGLILNWETPLENPELVSFYTAEYRINGEIDWAILIDYISPASREVTLVGLQTKTWYDFRMFAFTPGSFSLPSNIETGFTGDIIAYVINDDDKDGLEGSVLAGIIAGLVFLIIALVLMIVAIIIVRRRRQKKRELQEILGLPSYVQQGHRSAATSTPSFTLPFKESYSSLKAKFSPAKINPPKASNRDATRNGLKQRVLHKPRSKDKHIRKSPRSLRFEVTSEPSVVDHSIPEMVSVDVDRGEEFGDGSNWNQTMLSSRPDEVLGTSEYALEVDIDDEVFVHPRQFSQGQSRPSQQAIGRNVDQSQTSVRIPTGAKNRHGHVFTTSSPLNDITQTSFALGNVSSIRPTTSSRGYLKNSSGRLKDERRHYIPQRDSYNASRDENINIHSGVEDRHMTMRDFSMSNSQRNNQYSGNRENSYQRVRNYPNDQSTGLFVLRGDNSTNYIRRERIASPVSAEFYRREQKVPCQRTLSNGSLIRESSIDPAASQKVTADVHYQKNTPSAPVMVHSRQTLSRNDEYKRTAPFLKRRRRTQEIDVSRLPQSQDNHYSLDRRKVHSVGDLRGTAKDLNSDRWSYMNSRPVINPRAYGSLNQRNYKRESQDFRIPLRYELSYAERLPLMNLPYIQPSMNENDTLEVSPNYSGVSSSTSGVGSMVPSINNVSPRPSNSVGPLSPYSQGSSGYGSRTTSQSVSIHGRNSSVMSNRGYMSNNSSLDCTFEEPLQVIDTYGTYGDPFTCFTDIPQEPSYTFDARSRKAGIKQKPRVHFNNLIIESPSDNTEEERWFARLKEEFNEYKRQQEIIQRRKLVSSV